MSSLSWSLSEKRLLRAVAPAVTHHVGHVLRVDDSGWPFSPQVTPLTFGLLDYPFALLVPLVIYSNS